MRIPDYLKLLDRLEYRNARLYASGVMVDYKGCRVSLTNLISDMTLGVPSSDQNKQDVITAIGSGIFHSMRRGNKRAQWIRKLVLRKLDLAK
jgi:hypothetical protein